MTVLDKDGLIRVIGNIKTYIANELAKLTKANVGLDNVDNTSDADKPISTQQQYALNNKVDKVNGKGLSTNDFTTDEKNKLSFISSGAEVNQFAYSNVSVDTTTLSAGSQTDTLQLVAGSNITLTPDSSANKITISSDGGGGGTVSSLTDLGVNATAEELNYVDGVTSNIQTQLNGKSSSNHNHNNNYMQSSTSSNTYTSLADFWTHCDSLMKNSTSKIISGRAKLTTFTPIDGWFRYIASCQNPIGNGQWSTTGSVIIDSGSQLFYGVVGGGITNTSDLTVNWFSLGGNSFGSTLYQTSEPTTGLVNRMIWIA